METGWTTFSWIWTFNTASYDNKREKHEGKKNNKKEKEKEKACMPEFRLCIAFGGLETNRGMNTFSEVLINNYKANFHVCIVLDISRVKRSNKK